MERRGRFALGDFPIGEADYLTHGITYHEVIEGAPWDIGEAETDIG